MHLIQYLHQKIKSLFSASNSRRLYQKYSPGEVLDLLHSPAPPVLIDVREQRELESHGWINGMIHIPMNKISEQIHTLDKDSLTIIYCAHGIRSSKVAFDLSRKGFNRIGNMKGGLSSWSGPLSTLKK